MKHNDWKKRLGMVYSTNPDFDYNTGEETETPTLPNEEQHLRIVLERKGRGGKTVTLITGFCGSEADLEALCKKIKTKCGVGGTAKDGEIVIQGDMRQKVEKILSDDGYKCKMI